MMRKTIEMTKQTLGILFEVILSCCLFVTIIVFLPNQRGYTKTSSNEIKTQLQEKRAVIVDLRETGEQQKNLLPGTMSLPISFLWQDLRSGRKPSIYPSSIILYLFCGDGKRSPGIARALRSIGFSAEALPKDYNGLKNISKIRGLLKNIDIQ